MPFTEIITQSGVTLITESETVILITDDSVAPPNPPFPPSPPPFCVLEPIPPYVVPMQALDEPSELIGS